MKLIRSRFGGIIYMTMAALAFSVMVVCVKFTTQGLPSLEVVFFRGLLGVLIIGIFILRKHVSFVGKLHGLLFLRGSAGFLALALHFYTISKLPLGTAVTLNYTAPVFTALLAVFFLKERPGLVLIAMTLLAFSGVWLLVGGQWGHQHFFATLALASGFFASVATVTIRRIRHRESPFTIIFYFVAITTLATVLFLPRVFRWPTELQWLGLAAIGITSSYGQIWMTIALRRAAASLVSPFTYLTPVFSFLAGFLLWQEKLSLVSLFGAILIIVSGIVICIKEATVE